MSFVWIQPKICNENAPGAVPLPETEHDVSCGTFFWHLNNHHVLILHSAACNPGFYRPAIDSIRCYTCPNNTYSAANAIRCRTCERGEVAPRKFIMNTFEEWPSTVRTSCSGDCGTDGWRLRYDHIDSGEGHGRYASVQFSFNVTLEAAGELQFTSQFNCSSYCTLQVVS